MKGSKRSRRRWLRALLAVVLVAAVLVAALPLWLPWVLRPLLAREGVTFDRFDRPEYARFALVGVRGAFSGALVTAGRVECELPTLWLWRRNRGTHAPQPGLTVSEWRVEITDVPMRPERESASTAKWLDRLTAFAPELNKWLPHARMERGVIKFGTEEVAITSAQWKSNALTAAVESPRFKGPLALAAALTTNHIFDLDLRLPSEALEFAARLDRRETGWHLAGSALWLTNRATVAAEFDRSGWAPATAMLTAEALVVPASRLGLDGYETVGGSLRAQWTTNRLQFALKASARPADPDTNGYPPVNVDLRAIGDLASIRIDALTLRAPGALAELSAPIAVDRRGRLLSGPATLRFDADLGRVPGSPAQGAVSGTLQVAAGENQRLEITYDVAGAGIEGWSTKTEQVRLRGALRWPSLEISRAEARLTGGTVLGASGGVDFARRVITDIRWRAEGPLLQDFLPEGWSVGALHASGRVSGPFVSPGHSGRLDIESLRAPGVKPLTGHLDWRGTNATFESLKATLVAGETTVRLEGSGNAGTRTDTTARLHLQSATWLDRQAPLYALRQPCLIEVAPLTNATVAKTWRIHLAPLQFAGTDRELTLAGEIEWPRRGHVRAGARRFESATLTNLLARELPEITLASLELEADWADGPVRFRAAIDGQFTPPGHKPFDIAAKFHSEGGRIHIEQLEARGDGGPVASIHGRLPATLSPGAGTNWFRLYENQPFAIEAATEPNPAFWNEVGARLGVRLGDPKVELAVAGTPTAPRGQVRVRLERLEPLPSTNRWTWPAVEKLDAAAIFDRGRIELSNALFHVQGNPVTLAGEMPLEDGFWSRLIEQGTPPDWRAARARIDVAPAPLASFSAQLPEPISSQGEFEARLELQPGGELTGWARITNAATRPLLPLGPLRAVAFELAFSNRTVRVTNFTGRLAAEPVSVAGEIQFPPEGPAPWHFNVRAARVPLAYEPGFVLRGDLDLRLERSADAPPLLTGKVGLHDGLFLQDIKALVPGGRAAPARRPPYFSVEEAPFADWRLDVNVAGDEFLRIRSPYLHGQVSAGFQLGGTLREPIALGEARLMSGRVVFPFGTLAVESGFATTTSDSPHDPQLAATAAGRVYGYNIRMELSGTSTQPLVTFTSTPPLTSERILLMLAAGALPRDEPSASVQQRAGSLALYLGRDFLSRLLGIEGSEDRLTIRSGENVTVEGGSTYYLEYKLDEDWSVVTEYDRFNALNAGIKWRLYSK